MTTPKKLLLEHLYHGDLAAEVARRVEDGQSWRTIAAHVSKATGQDVSYESLRVWYGNKSEAAA